MVIREILKKADKILSEKGIEDSYSESAILFAYVTNKSKTYIYTHMDSEVKTEDEFLFNKYINQRALNMPTAYIVNKAWFMSLEFYVNETTLIPRPETEGLVEEVLIYLKSVSEETIEILDMCTGSGCIGISVAYYNKKVSSTLADISTDCIEVAEKNAKKNNLCDRVNVIESDLFKAIENQKFDVITVNPPYIPTDDINSLDDGVRLYEPITALSGGKDGLDFYRKIAENARDYLKHSGRLFMEIGINQSLSVKEIFENYNYTNITIKNDISGIPRVISVT